MGSARVLGIALLGTLIAVDPLGAQIGWDESAWEVMAEESAREAYLGRDAMYLNGGTAWWRGGELRDGIIEFDIAVPAVQGFHGLRFRMADRVNHEYVYLRPHLSGKPDAVQYTPIDNGLTGWQFYSDARYAQAVTIPADRWVHVRVAIRGRRMEMTVDGQLLVFPQLDREPAAGRIGLTASGDGAHFANFVVRSGADPGFSGEPGAPAVEAEPGTVDGWRVSEPFPESVLDGVTQLPESVRSSQSWIELPTHVRGVTNIAKGRVRAPERNTVFASVTLHTEAARTARVRIGFSDRVRVFLNGRQLFHGTDGYASRDYRFLGTMGLFDELFLPLEPGENELWLAVSEDFGGWGVTMQIPAGQGVRLR